MKTLAVIIAQSAKNNNKNILIGPCKLPGLSRNKPLGRFLTQQTWVFSLFNRLALDIFVRFSVIKNLIIFHLVLTSISHSK